MNAQTKVYVYPVPARSDEIDLIKRSIMDAGCVLVCSTDPASVFRKCITGSDALVILVCTETSKDPNVEEAVDLANRLGKRVVGVWSASADGKLPRALHRLGDGMVRLNIEELAGAICGGEPAWVEPTGQTREKPPTPRHKG